MTDLRTTGLWITELRITDLWMTDLWATRFADDLGTGDLERDLTGSAPAGSAPARTRLASHSKNLAPGAVSTADQEDGALALGMLRETVHNVVVKRQSRRA